MDNINDFIPISQIILIIKHKEKETLLIYRISLSFIHCLFILLLNESYTVTTDMTLRTDSAD